MNPILPATESAPPPKQKGRRDRLSYFLASITVLAVAACLCWTPIDGVFDNLLLATTGGGDTEWAPGYSDDAFKAIRIGMCRKDVYALLGKPFEKEDWQDGEPHEAWSRSPGDTDYRRREVVFKDDIVIAKIGEVYFD